ncbi:MAG TPA: hypothetical protein VIG99_27790 [Myxococcaceae bacterium]
MIALVAAPARADMLGGDLPLLGGLIAQTAQTVTTLGETLSTLRQSYEQAKRVAGYADDAYRAFQAFQGYSAELFAKDLVQGLETAYPDVGYFRREASGAGPWARGSGELQRLLRLCIGGPTGSCGEFQEAVSYQQTRQALAETFGTGPEGAFDIAAADHETAVALASGSAQQGRSEHARQLSEALLRQCDGRAGEGGSSLAACQAAAASASIEALKVNADLADQVAAGTRVMAMQLQLQNQQRKRELREAEERRALLVEGARQATERPQALDSDGFNLIEGGTP